MHTTKAAGTDAAPLCTPAQGRGPGTPPLCTSAQGQTDGFPPPCAPAEGTGKVSPPLLHTSAWRKAGHTTPAHMGMRMEGQIPHSHDMHMANGSCARGQQHTHMQQRGLRMRAVVGRCTRVQQEGAAHVGVHEVSKKNAIPTSDSFLFPSPKPTKHHTIVFTWRQLQGIVRTPSHAHLKGLKTNLQEATHHGAG